MLDVSLLTRNERTSLALALEMTADFLGIKKPDFAPPFFFSSPAEDGAETPSSEDATPERRLVIPAELWERPGVAKYRAELARKLYADDLRADLVDRAVYAVVAKLASKHDVNRLVHNSVQSARDNARKGKEPTRAWLLFHHGLKAIYESAGIDFPKMSPRLEPEPADIAARREKDERDRAAIQRTLKAVERRDDERDDAATE